MRQVLVIAAHPDDELLGCGGTIIRHIAEGDKVHILIMAEGATARETKRTPGKHPDAEKLFDKSRQAAALLGAQEPIFAKLHDNRMDSYDFLDLVKIIEKITTKIEPEIVYTHHGGDLNIDHQLTHRATLTALRPLPGKNLKSILTFETLSSTEWSAKQQMPAFEPQYYVDIEKYIDKKIEAIKIYDSEIRKFPHPRSITAIRSLATQRGSAAGLIAAEAFQLVILINRSRSK